MALNLIKFGLNLIKFDSNLIVCEIVNLSFVCIILQTIIHKGAFMATFSKNEVFTATQVVRNFSQILNKVSSSDMKRVFIVKNNKFEAVLLNMDEYERLSEAVVLLEAIYSNQKKENNGN